MVSVQYRKKKKKVNFERESKKGKGYHLSTTITAPLSAVAPHDKYAMNLRWMTFLSQPRAFQRNRGMTVSYVTDVFSY